MAWYALCEEETHVIQFADYCPTAKTCAKTKGTSPSDVCGEPMLPIPWWMIITIIAVIIIVGIIIFVLAWMFK